MSLAPRLAAILPPPLRFRLFAWQYRFFEPELRFLRDLVPSDRLALDVGAWWGPWTWWLARRVPVVHAFEPNPKVAAALARVVPANVRVHAQAVSDEIGWANLSIPSRGRRNEGRASLLPSGGASIQVPTVTLDSLALPPVGFLKIDVEGYEHQVLSGARRVLVEHRPNVLVEVEHQFHAGGPSIVEIFGFLTELGYQGRFLLKGTWQSLERFDLQTHQLDHLDKVKNSGLLQNTLFNSRRYVNNFAFFPKEMR